MMKILVDFSKCSTAHVQKCRKENEPFFRIGDVYIAFLSLCTDYEKCIKMDRGKYNTNELFLSTKIEKTMQKWTSYDLP